MPKKITTEEFIKRANIIHHNKYDYSKTEYKKSIDKVCIICPEHGEFWQTPNSHLSGYGCRKCGTEITKQKESYTLEAFLEKANQVHNNKYDYSKVDYKGCFQPICIICPEHGEFWQTPAGHLNKRGCPKCGVESSSKQRRKTLEWFIENANRV